MSDDTHGTRLPPPRRPDIFSMPRTLPRNVLALGVVSLLMGTSSQMIHSLLPLFLVTVLGASTVSVGIIEGVAEATNAFAKVFSGTLSDWLGRRKPLVVLGYGLAALSKPLFPMAGDVVTVLAARFIDRTGKGIRDAPRDALLADELRPSVRGAGFGLRIALFTIGSVVGPLLAGTILWASGDFRLVFWAAALPALACVVVLVVAVKEPRNDRAPGARRLALRDVARLPGIFWWLVAITALLELTRFSQAFLLLKAKDVGVAAAWVPAFLILMSAVYGLTAYPCGILADHANRRWQLCAGVGILAACHLTLAVADTVWMSAAGAALWGLQMGVTQGLVAATIADAAPENLRGTAFGIYYLVDGVASFLASAGAGLLWSLGGAGLAFGVGAALALVVASMILAGPMPHSPPVGARASVDEPT
ncbi:MAG: MFS transporter [Betaproteobacteria bacterium]|nr:MAG: MFS transporter [Betaproteobacteria bacterium]